MEQHENLSRQDLSRREEIAELAEEAPLVLEMAQRAESKGDEQASAMLDLIESLTLGLMSLCGHQRSLDKARGERDMDKVRRYGQQIRRDVKIIMPLVESCKAALRLGEDR